MNNNMLRQLLVVVTLTIISISIQAQDLIITNEGDSLNCKITKIKSDYIYFTFKHKDEIRSTLLPLYQVKVYRYNFYLVSEVPAEKVVNSEMYPHFRMAINGGWSNRIAKISDKIPSFLEQYTNELKSGYHYGLDLSYYFSEQIGMGIKYNNYRSKNELDYSYIIDIDGSKHYGKMSDDISIHFVGPFYSTRILNANKKNSFIMNLGFGYIGYANSAVFISDFTIKSSTVGVTWDIGYDISLSENFALGFQLSYIIGTLTQFQLSDGMKTETFKLESENYENLSRIDLTIGLRFNK